VSEYPAVQDISDIYAVTSAPQSPMAAGNGVKRKRHDNDSEGEHDETESEAAPDEAPQRQKMKKFAIALLSVKRTSTVTRSMHKLVVNFMEVRVQSCAVVQRRGGTLECNCVEYAGSAHQ